MKANQGCTIKLDVSNGACIFYASYTNPNPSSAQFDHTIECENTESNCEVFIPPKTIALRKKRAADNSTQPLYSAIEGSGVGQTNKFKLRSFVGDQTGVRTKISGAAFLHDLCVWQLMAAVLMIILY